MSQNHSLPPQDDFTRALLRSAEIDEPSNAAYTKVATALGVSTAVGVGASLPAPAAFAAGSSGLARWSSSLGGKLALLGVSGALLVGAGGALLRHRLAGNTVSARAALGTAAPLKARPTPEPAQPGAPAALNGAAAATLSAADAPSAADVPTDAPDAANAASPTPLMDADAEAALASPRPARSAGRTAFAGAARSSGSSGSSLSEQVQSLDRARVALGSGNAGTALAEIAHYRKAWPRGVFLTEASVLEIEALAKRGERSLAAARAQAFVTAHPDSPQAERLRALIPTPPAEQP